MLVETKTRWRSEGLRAAQSGLRMKGGGGGVTSTMPREEDDRALQIC